MTGVDLITVINGDSNISAFLLKPDMTPNINAKTTAIKNPIIILKSEYSNAI